MQRLVAVLLPGLLFFASLSAQDDSSEARPNVVLLIGDDQHYSDFGFMGSDEVQTPSLDQLAEQSLVYPNGYVPTALCRPSLMTLATGLYPHQHKITGNDPPRGTDRERMLAHIDALDTLPELLGRAGYRSLQTGKWWEGHHSRGGFDEGMTHGDPKRGGRHGDVGLTIGRQTMKPVTDFIDRCTSSKTPFFVWYAPFLPHTPHNPPARLLAKYQREGVPAPIAKYRAMCEWFDETCGTLLGHLDERGVRDNTLVILVTDNGWIQKPKGRGFAPRSKRTAYEGGVRTPILVSWPGRIAPTRRDTPVNSVDIPPTILAACGVERPAAWPGIDLAQTVPARPVVGASFTHDAVDIQKPSTSLIARWIRRGRYKLIARENRTELFDLADDPDERSPLDDDAMEDELRAALDAWWNPTSRSVSNRRPNLLLVVTDDQRNDLMSCAGHPTLRTPTMDALAAEGVRFTNAFVTTSICAASRATIMTGRREGRHRYTFGQPPMDRTIGSETYFARLHDAGYRTGFVGKWGVKFAPKALGDALDYSRRMGAPYLRKKGPKKHLTGRTADAAIEFLNQQDGKRPFCLSISFNAPHAQDNHPDQYIPPPALADVYSRAEIPEPPLGKVGFDALPPFLQESLGRVRWFWRFDTRAKQVQRTRDYFGMIAGVDAALRRVMATLDERGLADNTVVVFTGDNGYFLGERGLAGKWLIYERSIRVPLIIRDPRLPKERRGTTSDAMALNLDLAPTLLDLAGLDSPKSYEGRSLAPWVRGETPAWRDDFLYEHRMRHPKIPKSVGVRGQRFVYARYYEQDPIYEQLFDLREDPDQLRNLATDPDHASTLAELRKRCDALEAR